MSAEEIESFLRAVGERIQRIREEKGMTRRELGLAVGLAESSANAGIYNIETAGRATQIDTLYAIAGALGVTPGFLLDGGELHIAKTVTV